MQVSLYDLETVCCSVKGIWFENLFENKVWKMYEEKLLKFCSSRMLFWIPF